MPPDQRTEMIREAVGVLDDETSLEAAIDELLTHGFDRREISLVAGENAVQEKLGHMYQKAEQVEDDPAVPRVAYVSRESLGTAEGALFGGLVYVGAVATVGAVFATGGTLATAIVAAAMAGGAGGLIGSTLATMLGQHHADYLQKQLDRDGLLLWVRTRDPQHEARALEILTKYSAHDVHIHDIPTAEEKSAV